MVLTKLARVTGLQSNPELLYQSLPPLFPHCGQGEHGEAAGKPPGHDLSNLLVPGTALQ